MKVHKKAINKYMDLCPVSTHKCNSFSEIEYKINRAVDLGQVVDLRNNGTKIVRYYHLNFIVNKHGVVDMTKNKSEPVVEVEEKLKRKHYKVFHKVMV